MRSFPRRDAAGRIQDRTAIGCTLARPALDTASQGGVTHTTMICDSFRDGALIARSDFQSDLAIVNRRVFYAEPATTSAEPLKQNGPRWDRGPLKPEQGGYFALAAL
jgi:hypothetical protein